MMIRSKRYLPVLVEITEIEDKTSIEKNKLAQLSLLINVVTAPFGPMLIHVYDGFQFLQAPIEQN